MKRPAWWPTMVHHQSFYLQAIRLSRALAPSPPFLLGQVVGGAGGIRTPDFRLAKAALSQLSYGPTGFTAWWAMVDSHHRPRSYQDRALTG